MILLNGRLEDSDTINLDSGLNFGRGLFETMLINERPLFLKQHVDRINRGLPLLGIDKTITLDEVQDAVLKLQCKNNVLKLIVTEKNVIFITRSNKYTKSDYERGFRATIGAVRRNATSPLVYLKSLNYLDNVLEHEKALKAGFDEVLFLNADGYLAEGSLSNIFFAKANKIYTPSIDCGLLDGIIREFVLERFDVIEGRFSEDDLLSADSAFITNSVVGVMKLSSVNEKAFGESAIIRDIQDAYDKECMIEGNG